MNNQPLKKSVYLPTYKGAGSGIRMFFMLLIIVGMGAFFLHMTMTFMPVEQLNKTAAYYAENGARELGAQNLVTAVVVTYRGLDTLGEVTILFLAASIIGFFLKSAAAQGNVVNNSGQKASEILESSAKVLFPIIMLFGVYIFVNGHLSPGGGFQGGAVVASAVLLFFLAFRERRVSHIIISVVESISGISYVLIGVAGLVWGGGFLDNRILPLGEFGSLISAGAIPLIYSFIGLKVGAELSGVLARFHELQEVE